MTNVLVLGATGMLGGMVVEVLRRNPDLELCGTARQGSDLEVGRDHSVGADWVELIQFDALKDPVEELLSRRDFEWIVNAIGVLDARIDERDPGSVADAIAVNAAFPNRLAAALGEGQRVIQIATDGVFSGVAGPYVESDPHDASGIYARTKSLGEVGATGFLSLRCSTVGPEPPPPASLLGWVLSQPRGARVSGYTNHHWNGVTTWHFATLCEAVIAGRVGNLPSLLHVVPGDVVTKAELLERVLAAFGRSDIRLTPEPAETAVDRRLSTSHPELNRRLWAAAGYPDPPEVGRMIEELAAHQRRLAAGDRSGSR